MYIFKMKKDFKILLLYPSETLSGIAPSNLAILSACLKQDGFSTKLFDCGLYRSTSTITQDTVRSKLGHVKLTNIDDLIQCKETDIYQDFIKMIEEYKPDLIGITLIDSTIRYGLSFIEKIKDKKIPVIVGGVGPTFLYEKIFKTDLVDYICIGEGEEAIVELCNKMYNNEDCTNIRNIYTRDKDKNIIKNSLRSFIDLNKLPIPDFSIYEDSRIYRPFMGEVMRMIQIDIDRGCPFACTYCAAPSLRDNFKNYHCGIYYRTKDIDRIFKEIKFLIKEYNLNFVWISSETFMALSDKKFREFAERYKKEINLPMWCQSRLDKFTDEKTRLLSEMKCKNISVGLEHGSEEIRKQILNKHITNETIIDAVKLMKKYNIFPTFNNMIGLPDETRENIFETVELNRKLSKILNKKHNTNVFTFIPFSGTKLRRIAIEKGYIEKNDEVPLSWYTESTLTMPSISKKELAGLEKTLTLYIFLPKKYWPEIKIAEQNNEKGQQKFNELMEILKEYK